ncbi:MAG: HEAT repeat domain-containing protein [Planctomycetaceae bacterium]|nr:HEAT repeat domain-containing protein [Planctomycetaceae bacterium]
MNHEPCPRLQSSGDPPVAGHAPAREPRKFVIALLAGVLAAATVDYGMALRRSTVIAPPVADVRYDPRGPLETLPAGVLLQFAGEDDAEIRQRMIAELGRRGAIPELVELLGSAHADVRAQVPQALLLASQTAHDQIPLLVAALESADEAKRTAAAEALLLLVRAHGPYRGAAAVAERPGRPTR